MASVVVPYNSPSVHGAASAGGLCSMSQGHRMPPCSPQPFIAGTEVDASSMFTSIQPRIAFKCGWEDPGYARRPLFLGVRLPGFASFCAVVAHHKEKGTPQGAPYWNVLPDFLHGQLLLFRTHLHISLSSSLSYVLLSS